jgi:hypothetical protein
MALIYEEFAILPVGLSCQVAQQLYEQKDFVDDLVGEVSRKRRTPFDWIVSPASSVTEQLIENKYFPDQPSELTHMADDKIFYWDRMKSWFFHAGDAFGRFQMHSDKFDHLTNAFDSLADKRIIAIWTNCQINMVPDVTTPPLDNLCRRSDMVALQAALRRFNPKTDLIPVVLRSRIDPDDPVTDADFIAYDVVDPPDRWRGDADMWRDIFTRIFKHDQDRA